MPGFVVRAVKTLLRLLRRTSLFLTVFAAYLIQVCVLPRIPIGGVTVNILYPVIAVAAVCYGRLRAFWAGAIFGILMEAMQPTLSLVNLVIYPANAVFCAFLFADKTPQKLEYERSIGKPGRNASPYWRTIGCAAMGIAIHETVNLLYIALGSSVMEVLGSRLTGRALLSAALSTLLALPVMMLLRPLFGFPYVRKRRKKKEE